MAIMVQTGDEGRVDMHGNSPLIDWSKITGMKLCAVQRYATVHLQEHFALETNDDQKPSENSVYALIAMEGIERAGIVAFADRADIAVGLGRAMERATSLEMHISAMMIEEAMVGFINIRFAERQAEVVQ